MLDIQTATITKISSLFAIFVTIYANSVDHVWESTPKTDTREMPGLEIVPRHPHNIALGSSASFTCKIRGAQEQQVWWTRDDRNLTSVNDALRSRILAIEKANGNDTGNYTCLGKTTEGNFLNETIHIRVLERGKITAEQNRIYAKLNENVTLSCHAQGYLLSNFTWQFKSDLDNLDYSNWATTTHVNETYVIMSLTLSGVMRSDDGSYKCRAHDFAGSIGDKIFLVVTVAPDVDGVSAEATGVDSVQLSWFVDDSFDSIFRARVMYKVNGTEEWRFYSEAFGDDCEGMDVTGLENGTAYKFKVVGINSVGESPPAYSQWVTTWKEDFIPTVRIEATTLNSITTGWTKPAYELRNGLITYNVTMSREAKIVCWKSTEWSSYTFRGLEPGISYGFRVKTCDYETKQCADHWSAEETGVTIDRDPKFVPVVEIKEMSLDSMTVGWSAPPPELRDRVRQYKVLATHRDHEEGLVYLPNTVNSIVFENLTSNTSYLVKVAACSDYKTQCGNWSAEQEGFTIRTDTETPSAIWPSVIVAVILLVVMVAWMSIRKRQEEASRRRLVKATIERFNRGAMDCLDPELNMAEQAELLPYNKKWEFPRELLKLDKILGSGAFGIVRKAEAKSICRYEPVTTVAVKVVRATANLNHMTALSRELKILGYLGKHLNVVNLLGACTRDISYGQLLVIVEFCRYGNLHDYLLRGRDDFIDQIENNTAGGSGRGTDHLTADDGGAKRASENSDSAMGDCCQSPNSTDTSLAIDDHEPDTDAVELDQRNKYQGDYTDQNLEPISTRDLLCWAWQVSRGMKYLGSRRILHGDLAARNVLLADGNVVKICDFGLARALHTEDNYTKKGHDPLPLKWMAIESIKDRVFSVRSDVWSYGIVLWEFFTLAETPYPGMHPGSLYQKLVDGFRMARPKYAPDDIYQTMLRCWDAEPTKRPSFEKLERIIGDLLDASVKTHYLDLSTPYVQMNADVLERGEIDYLTMEPSKATCETTVGTMG